MSFNDTIKPFPCLTDKMEQNQQLHCHVRSINNITNYQTIWKVHIKDLCAEYI